MQKQTKKQIVLEWLIDNSQNVGALATLLDKQRALAVELANVEKQIAEQLHVSDESIQEQKPTTKRRKIALEVLGLLKKGIALNPSEIAKQLDAQYASVFQALRSLEKKQQVLKTDGKYSVVNSLQTTESKKAKKPKG